MARKKTNEQFVAELKKRELGFELLEKYINSKTKILCQCKKCGNKWKADPSLLLKGSGCPQCGRKQGNIKRTKTKEELVKELSEINDQIEIIGDYYNNNTKIQCRCKTCKHEWSVTPNGLLQGSGCPACALQSGKLKQRKSHEQFVQELLLVNEKIEICSTYINSNTNVKCHCKKCCHEWETKPYVLLQGHGCPRCGIQRTREKRMKSSDTFSKESAQINPNIQLLDSYKGANIKTLFLCSRCGHKWETTPHMILQGKGCPNCAKSGTSFMEQFFRWAFSELLGSDQVLFRNRKTIGRELDILVPKYRFAIEPGAWAWHKSRLKKDIQKIELCNSKGIKLYIIYDSFPKGVIVDSRIQTFPFDLGSEDGFETLKSIVEDIINRQNLPSKKLCWEKIIALAQEYSMRMSTEGFVNRLATINPMIIITGQYRSYHEKIRCFCKRCGHEWEGRPAELLRGEGCPQCGKKAAIEKRIKSQDVFTQELLLINPNIELLEAYQRDNIKTKCKCKKCGHEWSTKPTHLLQGHGCPQCAYSNVAKKLKKTTKEFIEEMTVINPLIEITGEYIKAKTRIKCRCKMCGNEWSPTPDSLHSGRGCPICGRKKRWK